MTKDELIEKHRYINVEHDRWWDSTYADFKVSMTAVGINVDKMYFSGFSSQGDGACFEGSVADWGLFLQSLKYECPVLNILAQHSSWRFRVTHSGHYYHEYCTDFHSTLNHPDNSDAQDDADWLHWCSPYKTDTQNAAYLAVLRTHDINKLKGEFEEAFRGHMKQLYKDLEAQYDHLTSDEVVWETLEANEMTSEVDQPEETT